MKILHVINFFSPVHGGSVEVPYHLSKKLVKRGHEVILYTSDFKLSQEYIIPIPEVKIHAFKTWLSLAGFQVTPGIIKKAKEEIRHLDIIHMHNYRTFQNIIMRHYAKNCSVPYVLQAHGSVTTFFQKGWLKRTFDVIWGYRILKDASRAIAVTRIEAKQYQDLGLSEDRIETIPNGIDFAEFEDLPPRGEFRKRHGLSDNEKIVLYLGRINKVKGLDLLAKAFMVLSKKLTDAKLVIVGVDDGYLPSIRKLIANLQISDRVLFTGPLYGREKLEAYVDAEVYVLPSVYEIFGITVLEALGCGTPVIVTDRCGIADVIDSQAGLVVPYDEEQLRNAVLKLLDDDKMRQRFSQKGKLLVREKFNWERIVEQIEGLYERVIK